MSELFTKERTFWVVISVIVLLMLGVGGFVAYQQFNNIGKVKTTTDTTNKAPEKVYPAKTIIEDTADPNVKKVTPSKNDTIQVKSESGVMVEVPVYTPPKK